MTSPVTTPEAQHEASTDDWLSRPVTISRIPIFLSLVMAALKWFGVAGFRSLPWVWVFAPWWFAICSAAIHNYKVLIGKTWLVRCAQGVAIAVGTLMALRLLGLPGLSDLGWWVLTAPYWGTAALCWLNSAAGRSTDEGLRQLSARKHGAQLVIVPSKRLLLLLFIIIALKWQGISFLAGWSWPWMVVALALGWSLLCLYNVALVGGERYLGPAYVLFLVTIALAGWHGVKGVTLDLTWVVIFLPSVFYGFFCWIIVLPRIHDLNRRIERRNDYISRCIDSGSAPQPIELESKTVAAPLPGNDSRFRLSSLVILTIFSCTLHTLGGLSVSWSLSQLLYWTLDFHRLVGTVVFLVVLMLAYWWVFIPVSLAVRKVAEWRECSHRLTLWCVTILSCGVASVSFGWHFIGFTNFGFLEVCFWVYVLGYLFGGQAGALGLVEAYTPVDYKASPAAGKAPGDNVE